MPNPLFPGRPYYDQEALSRAAREARAYAEKVARGVLKNTHSFKEAESALEKQYEAEELVYGDDRYPSEVVRKRIASRMEELRKKHAKLNSREHKAKLAEMAQKRKAKEAAAAKQREEMAAAQRKVRDTLIAAKEKASQAEHELRRVESGVNNGTHTREQLEAAAREFFSLQFAADELQGKVPRAPYDRFEKMRWFIAERPMKEAHEAVLARTCSIEEAEQAITAFHKIRFPAPIDEARLHAAVAHTIADLKKQLHVMVEKEEASRRASEREELTRKKLAERKESTMRKLAAQAADNKLSPARRAAAQAKLEEAERIKIENQSKEKLNAARKKYEAIVKSVERLMGGAFKTYEQAERALEAEAASRRELAEIEKEVRIGMLVRQRVAKVRKFKM